jgi:molybdopterin molybdotransferase
MKEFFKVTDLDKVLEYASSFPQAGTEKVSLFECIGRVLAVDIYSDADLPGFARSTMDGYAVRASSTFGASEGNPAYVNVKGAIAMGETPSFSIGPGEAAKISTGGMLPDGTDSVAMIEHVGQIDDMTIEVYKSVAPGQHIIHADEDFRKGEKILGSGSKLRAQETGLLAAFGIDSVEVYKKPVVGIISTGDEIIPVSEEPGPGKIRDINTYTLSALVKQNGGDPVVYGIIKDDFQLLLETCTTACKNSNMVIISGGSSVGTRDFTIDVLNSIPDTKVLVHGIPISPGKPTILARSGNMSVWGLPGHVVSAMVVFEVVVKPFIKNVCGLSPETGNIPELSAVLSRNVPSAHGRIDFIRVRLVEKEDALYAEPVLGKSGLINTMIKADGLIKVDENTEGLDKGGMVSVMPLS